MSAGVDWDGAWHLDQKQAMLSSLELAFDECPLQWAAKGNKIAPAQLFRMCHNVWPGRAVQDGVPRSTNVRAVSMYQASEVERLCSGPSWVSARIRG